MLQSIIKWCMFPFFITFYTLEAMYRMIVAVPQKDVRGQTVLMTGAGSGIGQKMCIKFAKLGCKVVGLDISQAGLMKTEEMLGKLNLKSSWKGYKCDLSDRKAVYETASLVKSDIGDVDILVNNAGIVTGGSFLECNDDKIMKTMDVNCNAHFWTLKSFLPKMLQKNHGHVVTIASGAGLFGMANLVDYCASKFAAIGMSEALAMELHATNKTGVHVTIICPFYIDTGMFKGVKSGIVPMIKADDAVEAIVDGVLRNKSHVIMPSVCSLSYAMRGCVPTSLLKYFGDTMQITRSMESFVGRDK